MFHFTCFNVEDPHDPSVGLIHGDLAIPGNLLRREVFAPVVQQVRRRMIGLCLERADREHVPSSTLFWYMNGGIAMPYLDNCRSWT